MFEELAARHKDDVEDHEPRWPALVSLIAVSLLYLALPKNLILGPRWLLLAIVLVLSVPTIFTWRKGYHEANQILGYALSAIVTLTLIASVVLLVKTLPVHVESPIHLLRSAAALWITNILVFALWYWRLDAGGPHKRDLLVGHEDGAFLFPQMVMPHEAKRKAGEERWSPTFVDYLFLAFNTSTALSPTDTSVLSRWAKCLMMVQSLISLTVVALLAARAINILQ
jgi:uncharacterized membrane protein